VLAKMVLGCAFWC